MASASPVPVEQTKGPKRRRADPNATETQKKYAASVFGGELPKPLATSLLELQKTLKRDIWLIVQNGPGQRFEDMDEPLFDAILANKSAY